MKNAGAAVENRRVIVIVSDFHARWCASLRMNSYRKVGLIRTSAIIISRPYMTTNAPVADDAAASGKQRARGSSPGRIADPSAPRTTAPEFLPRLSSAAARRFAPSTRFLQLTNLGHPVGSAAAPDRPRIVRRTQ